MALLPSADVGADVVCSLFESDATVNNKVIIVSVAPSEAGDSLVVGGARVIRAADMLLRILIAVSVDLHNSSYTEVVGSVYEYSEEVFRLSEDVISGSADDDTAALLGDLLDSLILRHYRLLYNVRAEVEVVEYSGSIIVDVGDKFLVVSAFLSGKRRHFLVVEGDAELFRYDSADLLTR